jgi:hypothetical protein
LVSLGPSAFAFTLHKVLDVVALLSVVRVVFTVAHALELVVGGLGSKSRLFLLGINTKSKEPTADFVKGDVCPERGCDVITNPNPVSITREGTKQQKRFEILWNAILERSKVLKVTNNFADMFLHSGFLHELRVSFNDQLGVNNIGKNPSGLVCSILSLKALTQSCPEVCCTRVVYVLLGELSREEIMDDPQGSTVTLLRLVSELYIGQHSARDRSSIWDLSASKGRCSSSDDRSKQSINISSPEMDDSFALEFREVRGAR